ncbi:DUF333 domain-containing protein [Methanoregula sp.]|uniref:putative hemolysin n=1 Tax=Methanoregula sp. TaxID=2052170 RepID=UPI0026193440|nr:DUF333 domain-containing protein [Methanoregula sp.]MDD5142245.1 DUF333 domain-containing protein [Methanoregula sp.]
MISRTGIFVLLGACIIAGIFIAGCTQPQATTAVQTTAPSVPAAPAAEVTVGMANPASVNCGTLGGKTEIKTASDGGQYGMCTFTNGTTCEEWALFRGEGCIADAPVANPPSAGKPEMAGMANPASVNCDTLGDKIDIRTAPDGGQYGMCSFPNGTNCEEWALRGEGCKPYTAPVATTTATQ